MTLIKHQGQQEKKNNKTGFSKANEGSNLITVFSSNSAVDFFLPNVCFYLKELATLDILVGPA